MKPLPVDRTFDPLPTVCITHFSPKCHLEHYRTEATERFLFCNERTFTKSLSDDKQVFNLLMNYFFLYRGHVYNLWLFETAFSPLNFTTCLPSYFSLHEHSMIEVLIIHISSYRIQVSYRWVLDKV